MIRENQSALYVLRKSTSILVPSALLLVLALVRASTSQAHADANALAPAAASEFPHVVRFEQGATRFENGDSIAIEVIRGTADTFKPGNIYWIKGTYKLASHTRAVLAAYTTAMDSTNGTGYSFDVQTTIVNQGSGTFTLFLPISSRGWPHVSFYPAEGGGGFGGNYFGTGESVLKKWWGEK